MTPTPKRNNDAGKSLKLKEISELVGGKLVGDGSITITGVAGIKEAREGDITFLVNDKYLPFLDQTSASAVITPERTVHKAKSLVLAENPSLAFSKVASFFIDKPARIEGIHPTAVIDPSAQLGREVSVGPHAVIRAGVVVGDRSTIEANSFVGEKSVLGQDVWVYPNVTIREGSQIGNRVIVHSGSVIGSDGFGYETVNGKPVKIAQVGYVQIDDDVEIGANVCIDRGRFLKTWVQKDVKIDNLVQIAHNVVIGKNSIIVSQCGISGSTELGRNVIMAGQSGLVGHIQLGDNVVVGARSGVTKSVPSDVVMLGSPAKPISEQKRLFALISRLPEMFKDITEIKKILSGKK